MCVRWASLSQYALLTAVRGPPRDRPASKTRAVPEEVEQ